MGRVNENENRSKIAITAESKEEAIKLFKRTFLEGQVEMPMDENPDGTYFANVQRQIWNWMDRSLTQKE